MNKLVSIIIPTKNRLNSTKRAINSCISQDYSPIEVIIVDDCSTPENRLNEWINLIDTQEVKIKYIQLESSKGGGNARNIGVDESSGEFITFLDSDDIFFNNSISMNVLFQNKFDSKFITYGKGVRSIYKDDLLFKELGIYPQVEKKNNQRVGEYLFCCDGRMFTPTLFMERDTFDKVRFDISLPRHQDYGFVLKAESVGIEFKFINERIFRWISDENSESSIQKKITLDVSKIFLNRYSPFLDEKEINAYLSKIAAPIAIKRLMLLDYMKLCKMFLNKKYVTLGISNITRGALKIFIDKIRFKF